MSTKSSGHDGDLESQQTALLKASNTPSPRTRWSRIYLILRERNRKLRADRAEKASLVLDRSSSSSTSYYSFISIDSTGEADLQSKGSEEISSASNEVSVTVNLEGENDDCTSNAKLQQENIARMVKEKDLDSLQNFGGIQVIAKALNTDLENGIHGDEQDLLSRRIASMLSATTQAPKEGFFQYLVTSCNSYIIVLLSVSAVLSLGFGIKEEGRRTGWEEGVVIIVAIIVLVLAPSLRDFWLEHSQKMSSPRQKPLEMRQMELVDVFRGGRLQKVSIGDVLVGDIVCLEGETQIPADGLFISGELLKLNYDGLESTIDDKNPFLFYGAKVVGGTGCMLVTSVGMDTTWGQLMNRVTQASLDKALLPAKLDRVSTGLQIVGLSISILILVVSFLHFELGKEDVGSNHPDLKGKPTASHEIMDAIKRIVIKPNGKSCTLTTSLTMLLVGVTEGIPLVITLAITYWNWKMLSDKAFAQEPWACLTMSSVTTICIHPLAADICWTETRKAIEAWTKAGVSVILVSEANVSVLEAIALECGLLPNSNRLALEVENFQNDSNKERMNEVEKITVMGNSSPSDRLLLVQCLKKKGHKVAVVGGKIYDIPALKEADVGIVIESYSSEMARECSDIIIRDGNFSFLVTIIGCGRCTYDNILKYIQLELTMNIAGLLITSITTMSFGYSPISAIQLAWANFIVTLLGGLALLTEPLTEQLMDKPPLRQSEPLITKAMWRNLVSQALYQVAILVTFQFKGQAISGINKDVSKTIIFNTFVLCQVFNQVNARELERKNVFRNIHRSPWFLVAVVVIVGLQVAFIEIAHILVGNARLNWVQWFVCLLIGMVSWAIDWATKYTSGCILACFAEPFSSHMGTIGMTPSDPSECISNLELPLINGNSTPVPS